VNSYDRASAKYTESELHCHCQYDCGLGRQSLLAAVNMYDFRCLLNDEVDCCFLRSADNWFHTRGAAMLKALSLTFRRDRGTSKSLFLADRRADRDGMSETGVSSCGRYWLTRELCISKHNLYCILAVTGSRNRVHVVQRTCDHTASSLTQ